MLPVAPPQPLVRNDGYPVLAGRSASGPLNPAQGEGPRGFEPGPFFALAVEPMAAIRATDRTWLHLNPALERQLDTHEAGLRGARVEPLFHPDDRATLTAALAAAGSASASTTVRLRLRGQPDDHEMEWRFAAAADGGVLLGVGHPLVAPTARLEAQLRALRGELEHQVCDTLAVVRSLTRATAETSGSVDRFTAHLQDRIDAFSRVQRKLMLPTVGRAGVDLALLIEDELLAQAMREGDRLQICGPPLLLLPRAAQTLGLAIHELATNAVKFGAFGLPGGRAAVHWHIEQHRGGPLLDFSWTEYGVPAPAAGFEPEEGVGMGILLRKLPRALGGCTRVDFGPDGLRFVLQAPLSTLVAATGTDGAAPIRP